MSRHFDSAVARNCMKWQSRCKKWQNKFEGISRRWFIPSYHFVAVIRIFRITDFIPSKSVLFQPPIERAVRYAKLLCGLLAVAVVPF